MFTNAYKNDSHREYITLSRSFKISTTKHWNNINNNNNNNNKTSRLSFSKFKTSLVFFLGISRLKIPPLTTAIFQISYNDRAKSKGKSRRSRSAFMTVKEVGGTTKEQEWWSFESLALALDWTKQSWSLK